MNPMFVEAELEKRRSESRSDSAVAFSVASTNLSFMTNHQHHYPGLPPPASYNIIHQHQDGNQQHQSYNKPPMMIPQNIQSSAAHNNNNNNNMISPPTPLHLQHVQHQSSSQSVPQSVGDSPLPSPSLFHQLHHPSSAVQQQQQQQHQYYSGVNPIIRAPSPVDRDRLVREVAELDHEKYPNITYAILLQSLGVPEHVVASSNSRAGSRSSKPVNGDIDLQQQPVNKEEEESNIVTKKEGEEKEKESNNNADDTSNELTLTINPEVIQRLKEEVEKHEQQKQQEKEEKVLHQKDSIAKEQQEEKQQQDLATFDRIISGGNSNNNSTNQSLLSPTLQPNQQQQLSPSISFNNLSSSQKENNNGSSKSRENSITAEDVVPNSTSRGTRGYKSPKRLSPLPPPSPSTATNQNAENLPADEGMVPTVELSENLLEVSISRENIVSNEIETAPTTTKEETRKTVDAVVINHDEKKNEKKDEEDNDLDSVYRSKLIRYYRKFTPGKLNDVDSILRKYKGNEELVFENLELRYGPDPGEEEEEKKQEQEGKS